MKVLVINGDCLSVNSSANLCHLAYIKGLIDLGYEVSVLSADGRDYKIDQSMVIPSEVKSYLYYGVSFYEKLSMRKSETYNNVEDKSTKSVSSGKKTIKSKIVDISKKFVLDFYGPHGIYKPFVNKTKNFKLDEEFEYVLSISTPPSGHLIAHNLLKSGNIRTRHWIQIWEDPWYSDAYGFNGKKKIYKEEKRLLSFAERVCYVSPLTLKNQKRIYPESADKMYWQPLPYYYKNEAEKENVYNASSYGYFGAYHPIARDLQPFYQAARENNINVNICGDPSDLFEETDKINIYPRMPLKELKLIEDKTNVLIFLCNRGGGQIPGKIYQYSATNKIILFILDGTVEERNILRDYFGQFNRYIFCENTVEDISRAIKQIESGDFGNVKNEPVEAFCPKETVRKILEG